MYSKKENKEIKQRFWIELGERSSKLKDEWGNPKKWILYKTDIKGIELKFDASNGDISVQIEINHKDKAQRDDLFSKFMELQPKLDAIFGSALMYEKDVRLPVRTVVSRISCQQANVNINDPSQKNIAFSFFISKMIKLEKVFEYFKASIDEFNFADDDFS